jgi:hypothetical protein
MVPSMAAETAETAETDISEAPKRRLLSFLPSFHPSFSLDSHPLNLLATHTVLKFSPGLSSSFTWL